MLRLPLAAAFGLALFASPAAAQEAEVTLTFDVGPRTGAVLVVLYDSEAAWSGGAPVAQAEVVVGADAPTATFSGLPSGTYGVKAFHDIDGDGRMGMNPFGVPTEPYAFSNNAVGHMGPPDWEQARFTIDGAAAQTLRLR